MDKIMGPGLYNMDCMEAMKQFPDGFFDLAIVDPPYGGGFRQDDDTATSLRGGGTSWEQRKRGRFGGIFSKYHIETDCAAAVPTGTASADASDSASTATTSEQPVPAGGGHRLAA